MGRVQIVSEEPVGPAAAQIVRMARHRAGMTQRRAADRCGVAQSVFSDYERGARDPSLGTLRRLLGPLGFDVSITLVRKVLDGTQLQGPLGGELRARLDEVLAAVRAHGATRVWAVGRIVEGLEDPEVEGLCLHADLPGDVRVLDVMADVAELFGYRYSVTVGIAYPLKEGGVLEPEPPCVELTALDGGAEAGRGDGQGRGVQRKISER